MKNNVINTNQKCNHPFFYTMDNDVYCNECHTYLGYFDPWKLCGFVKETADTIKDKDLNEETRKIDIVNSDGSHTIRYRKKCE